MSSADYIDDGIFGNPRTRAYDFMKAQNDKHTNDIALGYLGVKISYEKLFEKIELFASALNSSGIASGDYVTIVLPNIPEIVYLFYACNRLGVVANLIDPRTNAEAIVERTNRSSSKMLFILSDVLNDKVRPFLKRLNTKRIVTITPTDSLKDKAIVNLKTSLVKIVYGFKRYRYADDRVVPLKDFLVWKNVNFVDSVFIGNTPCAIVYTSGTDGGRAKGVVLSNESFNSMPSMQMEKQEGYERQNTFLGCIPFFSAYGAVNGMHNSLCNGWIIQLIPTFDPMDFDLLIKKYKPNNALGVPRFWESLVESRRLKNMDLGFLILPTCGGDKITPVSVERINSFFEKRGSKARLIVGYGATEFGGAFSVTVADRSLYEPGSVGIFMDGVIGRIIDHETGMEIEGREIEGELCVFSPSMMLGYFKDEEETKKITWYDQEGRKYYRTGDKVRIDSKGLNWVIDRYKRVIIRPDGHTVGASPIENEISQNKYVKKCAVVGMTVDNGAGAIPTAFVVLKNGLNWTEREAFACIDEYCRKKLPERDRALAYVLVSELPYTPMGKVDFRKLEETKFGDIEAYWVEDPLTKGLSRIGRIL